MVAKLRIALVLLIIGTVSGAAIVGVNALTEDRIEENRIRAQFEDYITMFPELSKIEEATIDDDDYLDRAYTVLDENDDKLGTIYRGHDNNSQGDITVLVGISGNTLVDVIISSTENTPSYVTPLVDNHVYKLSDIPIDEISYDSSTGATITYESIQAIIDAAVIRSGGEVDDPELDLYQEMFDDAETYETIQKFEDTAFDYETAVYNAEGAFVGFSYKIPLEEGTVYLLLDTEDKFLGFFAAEEDAKSAYGDALESFTDYEGSALSDIDHTADNDTETALINAIDEVEALLDGTTRVNYEYLSRYEPYMVDDNEEGTLYTGMSFGYRSENVIQVAIDEDGAIIHIELILTSDTVDENPDFTGIQSLLIDELDTVYGKTDITEAETDDAFAGASTTGGSIYDVLRAVFDYDAEREGE